MVSWNKSTAITIQYKSVPNLFHRIMWQTLPVWKQL